VTVPSAPEDFPASGPNSLASIRQRVIARMVDVVIVLAPVLVATSTYLEIDDGTVNVDAIPWWMVLVQFTVAVVYETVMLTLWGTTVGKWAVGIKVVRYADGARPDVGRATQRTALPNIFLLVALPFVAVMQWVVYGSSLSHPLRRGWHDRYAGTMVVRSR
jgi:uncharacterized RDD family membrane protein YckC